MRGAEVNYLTYLIYTIFFQGLVWGGTGYAVFWRGHSAYWFLLAFVVASCAYTPQKWIHGDDKEAKK